MDKIKKKSLLSKDKVQGIANNRGTILTNYNTKKYRRSDTKKGSTVHKFIYNYEYIFIMINILGKCL